MSFDEIRGRFYAIKKIQSGLISKGTKKEDIEVCIVGAGNVLKKADDEICRANIESVIGILRQNALSLKLRFWEWWKEKELILILREVLCLIQMEIREASYYGHLLVKSDF